MSVPITPVDLVPTYKKWAAKNRLSYKYPPHDPLHDRIAKFIRETGRDKSELIQSLGFWIVVGQIASHIRSVAAKKAAKTKKRKAECAQKITTTPYEPLLL